MSIRYKFKILYLLDIIDIALIENAVERENNESSSNTMHDFEMCEASKAVLNIVKAKELKNRDIIGTLDSYVFVKYRGRI